MTGYRQIFTRALMVLSCASSTMALTAPSSPTPNSVHLGASFDPVLAVDVGYARTLRVGVRGAPLTLSTGISLPLLLIADADFSLEMGASLPLVSAHGWTILGGLFAQLGREKNWACTAHNIAPEVSLAPGYTGTSWYAMAEAGFTWFMLTHLTHSPAYRDQVYASAVDGWYSDLGGAVRAGIRTGVTLCGRWRIDAGFGLRLNERFEFPYGAAPAYARLGVLWGW